MAKLSKTSIQLSPETLKWLDGWPQGMTRSEAIRLLIDRTAYLYSLMRPIGELAEKYRPILDPVLEEFECENYATVNRLLPKLVGGFIQESQDNDRDSWREELTGEYLDFSEIHKKVEAMTPLERIYLLDCIVARRDSPNKPD